MKAKERDYWETDGGLMLKVLSTGRKIWYVRYFADGKDHRVKIGEYPVMALVAARLKRGEL